MGAKQNSLSQAVQPYREGMRNASHQASAKALKNLLSEADLILSTSKIKGRDAQWTDRTIFCTHVAKLCQASVRPIGTRACSTTIRNALAQSVTRWILPLDHQS